MGAGGLAGDGEAEVRVTWIRAFAGMTGGVAFIPGAMDTLARGTLLTASWRVDIIPS